MLGLSDNGSLLPLGLLASCVLLEGSPGQPEPKQHHVTTLYPANGPSCFLTIPTPLRQRYPVGVQTRQASGSDRSGPYVEACDRRVCRQRMSGVSCAVAHAVPDVLCVCARHNEVSLHGTVARVTYCPWNTGVHRMPVWLSGVQQ